MFEPTVAEHEIRVQWVRERIDNATIKQYIFRGALDTHSSHITNGMLQAAVKALAEITKKPVPPRVKDFYGKGEIFELSKDYLIPKPNDPRVLVDVSMAIAKAACTERVSKKEMDFDIYQKELLELAEKIHGYSIENLN